MRYCRLHSHPVDKTTGLRSDQTISLTSFYATRDYPDKLRRVRFYDVAQLYRQPWQVELFFKWLKQHLRIKAFYGRSENAVRTQLWVALCVYALVAIVRKQVKSEAMSCRFQSRTFLRIAKQDQIIWVGW